MNVNDIDARASRIAAAIGVPARARMLYALADGRARTSTELAILADVTPSTASIHLQRLKGHQLVRMFAQGKHRYYSLEGADVASALEALSVLAGGGQDRVRPRTPPHLRQARTCYDHIAGALGVALHDRFKALGWLSGPPADSVLYDITAEGANGFQQLGIDMASVRGARRRLAFACVDWSERRPHVAGALGAAVLSTLVRRRWLTQELEGRVLTVTALGRREISARLGLSFDHPRAAAE